MGRGAIRSTLDERLDRRHAHLGGSLPPDSPLALLLRRAVGHDRRGARSDQRRLALAIEGGGLAGAVSAGMCVVLEAAGLIDAVDVIYGTSSGALNGSFTAAGQAALGSTNYEDAANRRFSNPLRLFAGRPAMDFDLLFDEIIRNRKPYDQRGLERGPAFRAIGVNLRTRQRAVLRDFANLDDLMAAVRISCSMPWLCGPPGIYRGAPMADGGLVEPIPYHAAISDGATDVIVLRSSPATHRKSPYPPALISLLRRRAHPALVDLVAARPALYNEHAAELERGTGGGGRVVQIAPAPDAERPRRAETDPARVRSGLQAGARAAAVALGLPEPDLLWQPAAYVTRPGIGRERS